jgi:hypothetical protein
MSDSRAWRHFDWLLLLIVAVLIGYGATMIYSAMLNVESLARYTTARCCTLWRVCVMIAAAAIDYRIWGGVQRIVYLVALILLVIALALGQSQIEVRRWITLPFFDVATVRAGQDSGRPRVGPVPGPPRRGHGPVDRGMGAWGCWRCRRCSCSYSPT